MKKRISWSEVVMILLMAYCLGASVHKELNREPDSFSPAEREQMCERAGLYCDEVWDIP